MTDTLAVVTVTLEDRPDGGLRVSSENLPGLILSTRERERAADLIVPAIQAIFRHRGKEVTVHPAREPRDLLRQASPRDVDVHVKREQYVVEVLQAA